MIDREMLFHLNFSRVFPPFVVEQWGNIAPEGEKYKPWLCLYENFFAKIVILKRNFRLSAREMFVSVL